MFTDHQTFQPYICSRAKRSWADALNLRILAGEILSYTTLAPVILPRRISSNPWTLRFKQRSELMNTNRTHLGASPWVHRWALKSQHRPHFSFISRLLRLPQSKFFKILKDHSLFFLSTFHADSRKNIFSSEILGPALVC